MLTALPEDAISRVVGATSGPPGRLALVCRGLRVWARQLRTTVIMQDWTELPKLRWAIEALADLQLVLANIPDWDVIGRMAAGLAPRLTGLSLRLDRRTLGPADLTEVALALGWNSFSSGQGYTVGPRGLEALADLLLRAGRLARLDLAGCNLGPPAGAAAVARLPRRLVELDLDSNSLGDPGAAAVASAVLGCPLLEVLSLADNGVGPEGAAVLGPALEGLRLRTLLMDSNKLSDAGLQRLMVGLAGCQGLQQLGLSDNQIGLSRDSGLAALASAVKAGRLGRLRALDVSENGSDGLAGLVLACQATGVSLECDESACDGCGVCDKCALEFY